MNMAQVKSHFESKGFVVEARTGRGLNYLQVTCKDPHKAFASGQMVVDALKYALDSGLRPNFNDHGDISCKTFFGRTMMIITPVLVNVFNK